MSEFQLLKIIYFWNSEHAQKPLHVLITAFHPVFNWWFLTELAEFNWEGEPEIVLFSKKINFEDIDKDVDIEVLGN